MADDPQTDRPEFPKVLVRVRHQEGGVFTADVRQVGTSDEEETATAEGYIVVEVPPSPFPAYPKWVYHADGRRQVVQTEADLEKLGEGFEDTPPDGSPEEPVAEPWSTYGTPPVPPAG